MASIVIYAGCYHFLIYFNLREKRENLTFSFSCLVVGLYAIACAGLYNAETAEAGIEWQKIQALALSSLGVAIFLFINDYTERKIKKSEKVMLLYFSLGALLPLFELNGLVWSDKTSIKLITLPFGQSLQYNEMAVGPLLLVHSVFGIFLGSYIIMIAVNFFRKNRQKGTPILAAIGFCFFAFVHDLAIYYEIINSLYLIEYSFIGVILIFTFSLTDKEIKIGKAKDEMLKTEKKYRTLFEASTSVITIVDVKTGKFTDCNNAAMKIQGLRDKSEVIGKSPSFVSPEFQPNGVRSEELAEQYIKEAIETGNKTFEWSHLRTDGTVYPGIVSLSPFVTGEKQFVMSITKDITERKRAEEKNEKLIIELKDALENLKTLSGMLPICSKCKKIKDDKGYWNSIESYIEAHSEALFSHGLCSQCSDELYSDEQWYVDYKKEKESK